MLAASYRQRVEHLRQLITFVQLMESEIHFARFTLPELIAKHEPQFHGLVKEFLVSLGENLRIQQGEHFSTIWDYALIVLEKYGLPQQVVSDFKDLGRILGVSDVNDQVKHLRLLSNRLEKALEVAEEEGEKHSKLWQYLAFSAGLFLVLLLI